MTPEDVAIAAQMRAWLENRIANFENAPIPSNYDDNIRNQHLSECEAILAHLDTLAGKRWRVVEWSVPEHGNPTEFGTRIEPGTRVLIVTEE